MAKLFSSEIMDNDNSDNSSIVELMMVELMKELTEIIQDDNDIERRRAQFKIQSF